jgi:muramoyltetrapeptide carboxypeptidase
LASKKSRAKKLIPAIQKGDIIDIVAPASGCTRAELHASMRALRNYGLVPRVPKEILGRSYLFSNDDAIRLKHLERAIGAADSKMIWCLRGGYGSIRLLEEMTRWKKPPTAKIFQGFSDITTLHSFFNERWGWSTYHGPLFARLGTGIPSRKELVGFWNVVDGAVSEVSFAGLKKIGGKMSGVIHGPIKGGNMAVLQSALGTPFALRPKGAILFFEDVGEKPHRVDRMFTQFAMAGWFDEAKAVVLGRFQNESARDRKIIWQDVIPRFARAHSIPIFSGLPVGHDPKLQMTLPLNTPAELSANGVLRVETGIAP